jgi:phage terminase large subunit-like protein
VSDKDALAAFLASPLGRFSSWRTPAGRSPQAEFFRAAKDHQVRIFRSGNQVGKTTSGAVDVLLSCLGWHPWSKFRPPVRWWASGLDWEFGIGQVIWPTMRELIPWSQVRSVTYMRQREPQLPLHIVFGNGSEITFKSADSGRRKFQGAPLHGVWLDEEHPAEIAEEARTRLIRHQGYLTCTLTPIMRLRWIQDLERHPSSAVFRASMLEAAEAGLLDLKAVRDFEESLPERQRRVRIHGDFVSLEGMVYPGLGRDKHIARPRGETELVIGEKAIAPWPLPTTWDRWASIDWGMVNPTAVVIACEDPFQHRLIVEKVYYSSGIRAAEWARLLETRLPKLRVPLISDHDAQARAECEAQGLPTSTAMKDVDAGLEAVERSLGKPCEDGLPSLVFVEDATQNDRFLGRADCSKLLWELEGYHYPQVRDGRPDPIDRPVKKDDHACDALRYLVISWERALGGSPLPPRAAEEWGETSWRKGSDLLRLPEERPELPNWRTPQWDD